MKISITPVTVKELNLVFEIDKTIFQPLNYPIFVLRQFYDLFPNLFLVARNKNGEIMGYVIGGISETSGWVLAIGTSHLHRKKGIGNQLLSSLENELMSRNITEILLTVEPENKAVDLYLKHGFIKIEEINNYYGSGEQRIIMKKNLNC